MNYQKIYDDLIAKRKRCPYLGKYKEGHHVVPRFMGGDDSKENIVFLTPREHFIAHLLLLKTLKGTNRESAAAGSTSFFMVLAEQNCPRSTALLEGLSITKSYEYARKIVNDALSKNMAGKMIVKDILTGERIGLVDVDHPKVISKEWVHHSKGNTLSEDRRKQLSNHNSGKGNPNFKPLTDEVKSILIDCVKCIYNLKGYVLKKDLEQQMKLKLTPEPFNKISIVFLDSKFGSLNNFFKFVEGKLGYTVPRKKPKLARKKVEVTPKAKKAPVPKSKLQKILFREYGDKWIELDTQWKQITSVSERKWLDKGKLKQLLGADFDRIFKELTGNRGPSLESYVKKYGPVRGLEVYEQWKQRQKDATSFENRVKKYGAEKATEIIEQVRERNRNNAIRTNAKRRNKK